MTKTAMFVCTQKGVHGKVWRVGEKASEATLVRLGGFVPDYFEPVGSAAADEAVTEVTPDEFGFKNNEERRNFLIAKGINVSTKATKAKLHEMITQVKEGTLDPFN